MWFKSRGNQLWQFHDQLHISALTFFVTFFYCKHSFGSRKMSWSNKKSPLLPPKAFSDSVPSPCVTLQSSEYQWDNISISISKLSQCGDLYFSSSSSVSYSPPRRKARVYERYDQQDGYAWLTIQRSTERGEHEGVREVLRFTDIPQVQPSGPLYTKHCVHSQ